MSADNMYDTADGVEAYATMAEGYDGRTHIEQLHRLLARGSEVLELGIGPGVDLDMLAERFAVVGSDLSQAFLDRYARRRPDVVLMQLDAITIDTDRRFDCIYSNKVLQHLNSEQLTRSLRRQCEVVRPGGLLLHGLWAGTTAEHHGGLHGTRYLPESFDAVVPDTLEVVECTFYAEMCADDSLRVVLRPIVR